MEGRVTPATGGLSRLPVLSSAVERVRQPESGPVLWGRSEANRPQARAQAQDGRRSDGAPRGPSWGVGPYAHGEHGPGGIRGSPARRKAGPGACQARRGHLCAGSRRAYLARAPGPRSPRLAFPSPRAGRPRVGAGRALDRLGSCEDRGCPRRQNAEAAAGLGSRGPPGTPAPGLQLQPEPRDPGPDLPRSAVCPHTKENTHIFLSPAAQSSHPPISLPSDPPPHTRFAENRFLSAHPLCLAFL